MREKAKGARKCWCRIMFTMVLMLLCMTGAPVHASSNLPTLKIKTIKSVSWNTVQFAVNIPSGYDTYQIRIYRSTSKNGKYRLIDYLDYVTQWVSYNGGDYMTQCAKKKVVCSKNKNLYTFEGTSLRFNKRYYYKVRLYDKYTKNAGKLSEPKAVLTALNEAYIVRGYVNNSNQVDLAWQMSEHAEGYLVYRKTPNGKWTRIAKVLGDTNNTFVDKNVQFGKSYFYQIRPYRYVGSKAIIVTTKDKYVVRLNTPSIAGEYNNPGSSVYGSKLSASELNEVRRVVQAFKANFIKKGMSEYEKVLTAYQYLRYTCGYAWGGWQYNGANTALGALVYGEAQCSGFARAMKALCDGIGISCYYVHANSSSANPSHQWNEVRVDGKWYIVDPQGGYFLLSGNTYKNRTGMDWNHAGLPECTADYKSK